MIENDYNTIYAYAIIFVFDKTISDRIGACSSVIVIVIKCAWTRSCIESYNCIRSSINACAVCDMYAYVLLVTPVLSTILLGRTMTTHIGGLGPL